LHTLRLIAQQPWRHCVTSLRSAHWLASSLKLAARCPVGGCWPSCSECDNLRKTGACFLQASSTSCHPTNSVKALTTTQGTGNNQQKSLTGLIFKARHRYASAVLGVIILSVRLSVVCHTRALWLVQRTYWRYFYTIWKASLLDFCHPTVVGGRRSLPPKMGNRSYPPPLKIAHVDRFLPVMSQQ